MIRFGELIGRASSFVRHIYAQDPQTLFSVKGMPTGELMKISQEGAEIFDLVKPILAEYEHILMDRFFKNPKMTPGEIKAYYNNQFNFIITEISSELRSRQKKK